MRALLLVVLLLAAPLAAAYPDPGAVPRYYPSACYEEHTKRFVHDYLGVVPPEWGAEMEGAACEIYKQTSAHFVLLTTADTEGESLESYALHLFEDWGIGDRERHDGILMLFVNDYLGSGESALRIEVGYGLEGVVNSIVTEETWELMVEARDEALAAGEEPTSARVYAMAMGMAYLLTVIRDGYTDAGFPDPEPAYVSGGSSGWGWQILFNFLVIAAVIVCIALLASRAPGNRGWGYSGPSSPAWNTPSSRVWVPPSGGFGGHSGGGFGGGGSFGGGRSGGGGRGGKF